MGPSFTITTTSGTGTVRLSLRGEIDVAAVPELSHHLRPLAVRTARLEVDLAGVTFLDSHGAEPLVEAATTVRRCGGTVDVVAWSPATRRLCSVWGVVVAEATGAAQHGDRPRRGATSTGASAG